MTRIVTLTPHGSRGFIFYVLGSVAAIAALSDLNMIIRGGLSGAHRVTPMAYVLCVIRSCYVISANTANVWPDFINNNLPIYLVILIMFFWLFRVYLPNGLLKKSMLSEKVHIFYIADYSEAVLKINLFCCYLLL